MTSATSQPMLSAIAVFVITVGVILGAVAIIIAWSAVDYPEQHPPGEVSLRNARRIEVGMTKDEVIAILGNPKSRRDAKGQHETWEYQIIDDVLVDKANLLLLVFDNEHGKTVRVLFADDQVHSSTRLA